MCPVLHLPIVILICQLILIIKKKLFVFYTEISRFFYIFGYKYILKYIYSTNVEKKEHLNWSVHLCRETCSSLMSNKLTNNQCCYFEAFSNNALCSRDDIQIKLFKTIFIDLCDNS